MKKCIKLAQKATGMTSPNPMVGCVIVNDNLEIIETGYHKKYGQNHAERDALLKIDNAQGLTLIVNLEPCSHFGKTPPCADFIIQKGIKRVVYGMQDVNPIVAGNGLKKLKDAKIEVIGPVLEDECKKLNEIFITNKTQKRPYIALKTATTIDGKIATHTNDSKWITSEPARNKGRKLRQMYGAILTTADTIITDNPTMKHKNKIILDRTLKTDLSSKIYQQGNIIIFHDKKLKPQSEKNIKFIGVETRDNKLNIQEIINSVYNLGIMSIFIEAGGNINNSFLPYIDKLYHFVAPKILADSTSKSCFYGSNIDKIEQGTTLKFESCKIIKPDILITYTK